MLRKRNSGYKGGQKYHRDAANEHKVTGRMEVIHNPVVDAVDLTSLRKCVLLATENVTRSDISNLCVEQRV